MRFKIRFLFIFLSWNYIVVVHSLGGKIPITITSILHDNFVRSDGEAAAIKVSSISQFFRDNYDIDKQQLTLPDIQDHLDPFKLDMLQRFNHIFNGTIINNNNDMVFPGFPCRINLNKKEITCKKNLPQWKNLDFHFLLFWNNTKEISFAVTLTSINSFSSSTPWDLLTNGFNIPSMSTILTLPESSSFTLKYVSSKKNELFVQGKKTISPSSLIPIVSKPTSVNFQFIISSHPVHVSGFISIPSLSISSSISFSDLNFQISSLPSLGLFISLKTNMIFQSATFQLASNYTSNEHHNLAFHGELQNEWSNVLNLKWMKMTKGLISFQLSIHPFSFKKISISSKVEYEFEKGKHLHSIVFQMGDNFKNFFFLTSVDLNRNSSSIFGKILPLKDKHLFKEIEIEQVSLKMLVTSNDRVFNNDFYPAGISLMGIASFIRSSNSPSFFVKRITSAFPNLPSTFSFLYHLNVKSFESKFQLKVFLLPIHKHFVLKALSFDISVNPFTSTSISFSSYLAILLNQQSEGVHYILTSELNDKMSMKFHCHQTSAWSNIFGLKGIHMKESFVSFGLMPTSPFISSLGLHGNLTIGNQHISVLGYGDILNPSNFFFESSFKEISLRSLLSNLHHIIALKQPPAHRKLMMDNIQNHIPPALNIKQLDLTIAPFSSRLQIGSKTKVFKKGFGLKGLIKIFELKETKFNLQSMMDNMGLNFETSFELKNQLLHEQFAYIQERYFPWLKEQTWLHQFIKTISNQLPQIQSMDLKPFNLRSFLLREEQLNLNMNFTYLQEIYQWKTNYLLKETGQSLVTFFMKKKHLIPWKKILHLPTCFTNADCKMETGNTKCVHAIGHEKQNQCVPFCGELGSIPFFGCIRCVTSLDCGKDSDGSCCIKGKCVKSIDDKFCGSCSFGRKCNSPNSGCIFGVCQKCITSLDCLWRGSAGFRCKQGQCM